MSSKCILYVQYTDPAAYPPLEHSMLLFGKQGWQVLVLGTKAPGSLRFELPSRPEVRVKRLPFVKGGWRQKLHYVWYSVWVFYWTWRRQPTWIYASDSMVCPIVWWLQRLFGTKVVYHEHDSPTLQETQGWFAAQVLSYRLKLARSAQLCILPQKTRAARFCEGTGRTAPTLCVWNCPRLDELKAARGKKPVSIDKHLIIYYHGSITPERLPRQLVAAVLRFKGAIRLRVAGYETAGSAGYLRELCSLAASGGAAEIIESLGTIPHRENLLYTASKAHIGLSLMPKRSADINMQHMVGASNKPFDYMACGLSLLVSNVPEWIEEFVKPGFAVSCDPEDPDSIEAALQWYLTHPRELEQMAKRAQGKIRETWNYEMMFANVLEEIGRHH